MPTEPLFNWNQYGGEIFIGGSDIAPSAVHFTNKVNDRPAQSKKQWYEANRERILAKERDKREKRWKAQGKEAIDRASRHSRYKSDNQGNEAA